MLYITSHRQGAILNHSHGIESPQGLEVEIEGISVQGTPVLVNGIPAAMDGQRFTAKAHLREKVNRIVASTRTRTGTFTQEQVLLWDRGSFPRTGFYLDDHVMVFEDLASERPTHAFDHFYLGFLKSLHEKYGFKVTLNCFFENPDATFNLTMMPGCWRSEFEDNSDWLRFSFHARAEFPDRPYAEASDAEFARDWDLVQGEILRFAGERSYIPPVVIHWANIHPACAAECLRRGVNCYFNSFRLRVMGGPSLVERQRVHRESQDASSAEAAHTPVATDAFALHYNFADEQSWLENHISYYDPELKVIFFRNGACCNLVPLQDVRPRLERMLDVARKAGAEAFSVASHEQYSFPRYPNYQKDHLQRIETAVETMVSHGCRPVFLNEGILGNTSWQGWQSGIQNL